MFSSMALSFTSPRMLQRYSSEIDVITKLTAELKRDTAQYRNRTIYITVLVLFRFRRSIATGSSAPTRYTAIYLA